MRIIYEANDGTKFNTAEECEHYESKSSILLDQKKSYALTGSFVLLSSVRNAVS